MSSVSVGGQTTLGCPISSFLSFESACSVTNVPACAAVATPVFDAACCSSLTSYGLSLVNCFEQHPLTCLDTSALIASVAGGESGNPCATPVTPSSVSGSSSAMVTTSTAVLTSSGSSAAPSSTTAPPTTTTPSSAATSGSSTSSVNSSTSPITITKSDAPKVGAGLEVYIGVALIGALAFLTM